MGTQAYRLLKNNTEGKTQNGGWESVWSTGLPEFLFWENPGLSARILNYKMASEFCFWLHQVLAEAQGIFAAVCGLLSSCAHGHTGSRVFGFCSSWHIGSWVGILAWEIPWAEGPCGLWSIGFQRVRRDLPIKLKKAMATHSCIFAWRIL